MKSLEGWDESLKEVADYQFYVAYDFYAKNNSHFHRSPYYAYYQGKSSIKRSLCEALVTLILSTLLIKTFSGSPYLVTDCRVNKKERMIRRTHEKGIVII